MCQPGITYAIKIRKGGLFCIRATNSTHYSSTDSVDMRRSFPLQTIYGFQMSGHPFIRTHTENFFGSLTASIITYMTEDETRWYGVRKISLKMECPQANKCYCYEFRKDATTGKFACIPQLYRK